MVTFSDTSALVPLLIAEPETSRAERWLREDAAVGVWTLTLAELLSALARRGREEPGATRRLQGARRDLLAVLDWSEVTAAEVVRRPAERLVASQPLRVADAMFGGPPALGGGFSPGSVAV